MNNKNLYLKVGGQIMSAERVTAIKKVLPTDSEFVKILNMRIVEFEKNGSFNPFNIFVSKPVMDGILRDLGAKAGHDLSKVDIKEVPLSLGLTGKTIINIITR